MLGIMDTYNEDDMHYQFRKSGNHTNNSILMNRVPKKVRNRCLMMRTMCLQKLFMS